MKLLQILKGERQTLGDVMKAIKDVETKVSTYEREKAKAEAKLQELQELSVAGEAVAQSDIEKLTVKFQDLSQKLEASKSLMQKLEGRKADAIEEARKTRLKEFSLQLRELQKSQRVKLERGPNLAHEIDKLIKEQDQLRKQRSRPVGIIDDPKAAVG